MKTGGGRIGPERLFITKESSMDEEGGSPQFTDLTESSLKGALRETQRKKKKLYAILVIAGIIPVMCLCGLVLYQLIKSAQVRNDAVSAGKDAVNYLDVYAGVTFLMAERGASARVVSIGGKFFEEQEQWRQNADQYIDNFDFSRIQNMPAEINSEDKFKDYLQNFRQEMLPPSVGKELKSGHEVAPLISGMEPLDVTKMMKALYKMLDSLIDEHIVHKAEQSNDVTCVVSGVPQYIDNDAAVIANFTIKLMQNIENFKVEDLTDLRIKLRIGIHTEPCAAGIIGHKSLRYSIFGESVRMASRMSRNSQVQKIQTSRQTKDALFVYGDIYSITERGVVDIFGIGKVKTYFLQGHKPGAKIPGKTGRPHGILKMK